MQYLMLIENVIIVQFAKKKAEITNQNKLLSCDLNF